MYSFSVIYLSKYNSSRHLLCHVLERKLNPLWRFTISLSPRNCAFFPFYTVFLMTWNTFCGYKGILKLESIVCSIYIYIYVCVYNDDDGFICLYLYVFINLPLNISTLFIFRLVFIFSTFLMDTKGL